MLNDELSDLVLFAAVADARSFTRAAAKLGKSQSALSQSVRRLEERLKLRLLTRTTRSVMPTPAGEQLLTTLRPALDEIEAQLDALSELRELPSGSLRLADKRRSSAYRSGNSAARERRVKSPRARSCRSPSRPPDGGAPP